MRKNFWPGVMQAMRAVRFGLLAALAGAAVVACGDGGGGGTAPSVLQANPTTPWELMTAGDIAQCFVLPASTSNAEKTARLIERQLAGAGGNANVLTLGDNAYFFGQTIGYTACYDQTKPIISTTLAPRPTRMAKARATTALTKAAGPCLR
jgi:acid phosphatase type 7